MLFRSAHLSEHSSSFELGFSAVGDFSAEELSDIRKLFKSIKALVTKAFDELKSKPEHHGHEARLNHRRDEIFAALGELRRTVSRFDFSDRSNPLRLSLFA